MSTTSVGTPVQDTSVYRAMSPAIATSMVDNSGWTRANAKPTMIYSAYYDAVKQQIRYMWGSMGASASLELAVGSAANNYITSATHGLSVGNEVSFEYTNANAPYGSSNLVTPYWVVAVPSTTTFSVAQILPETLIIPGLYYIIVGPGGTPDFTTIGSSSNSQSTLFKATATGTGTGRVIMVSPISTVSTALTNGAIYIITSVGGANFTNVGASANTVGTIFRSTGTTAGGAGAVQALITSTPSIIQSQNIASGTYYDVATVGTTDYTTVGGANTVGTIFLATGSLVPAVGTGMAYAVAAGTTNATAMTAGTMYAIASVGSTIFSTYGAPTGYGAGTIFIATGVGTGNGTVRAVTTSSMSNATYVSVIGGQFVDVRGGIDNNNGTTPADIFPLNYTTIASSSTSAQQGKYVSLDVINHAVAATASNPAGDVVVMAWYDQANNCLWYTYCDDPASLNSPEWQAHATQIDTSAGQYAKIKVDAGQHIHIAYYSNSGADLKYTYIPTYASAGSRSTMIVDSYEIVGTDINLDVGNNGSNYVPYISYYFPSATKTKIAYPVVFSGAIAQPGVDSNGMDTQNWETSVVPTKHTPNDDHTMIGLYKNTGGVIQSFPTLQSFGVTGTTLSSFPYLAGYNVGGVTDYNQPTLVGGNATLNPVAAYTVQDDNTLEMAQKD